MQKHADISCMKRISPKLFFPATFNPSEGRIFLSSERSKLCFELLGKYSVAQNNLPLQGAENPSEVGIF